MMNYIGMPTPRAIGTGAALGTLISLPGAVEYMLEGLGHVNELPPFSAGYVNLAAVALIIPASMFMAPYGVKASHALPHVLLRRVFAAVMLSVSVKMFRAL
jgi:uncharacterized membrane protein YfcA